MFTNFPVCIPPREEQAPLVDYLDRQEQSFNELTCTAEESISLLQERRSALISAAVTGQIDVRGYAPEAAVA
jgi:type I restriction enzyme S subunit